MRFVFCISEYRSDPEGKLTVMKAILFPRECGDPRMDHPSSGIARPIHDSARELWAQQHGTRWPINASYLVQVAPYRYAINATHISRPLSVSVSGERGWRAVHFMLLGKQCLHAFVPAIHTWVLRVESGG